MTFPSPIHPVGSAHPAAANPQHQASVPEAGVKPPSGPEVSTATPVAAQAIPDDEGLIAGFIRRLSAFANDLRSPEEALPWFAIASLSAMLIYSYWPGLMNARSSWDNPQYQHGWIVPLVSVILLVGRREPIGPVTMSARVTGFAVLAVTFLVRLFCAKYRIVTFDMYTFVPAILGVFLVAGGWSVFRWASAPLALLIFMYPLPDEAQRYITGPLQTFNTMASTFMLQTLGFDALRDGNVIRIGEHEMGVVDACAGLKMLTLFVWAAALVIVIGDLAWWERIAIALSAVPIAIFANTTRITIAGILMGIAPKEMAEKFHDSPVAAVLMMGTAVGLIMLEIKLLSHVIVSDEYQPAFVPAAPATAGAGGGRRPAQTAGFPVIPGFGGAGGRAESGKKEG